jgi:MFS family permease
MKNSGKPSFDRNYYFLFLEATIFGLSNAFRDYTTVLPVFLRQLTDSIFLIGMIATLYMGGWYFPQLLTAFFFERKRKLVPSLFRMYFLGRLPMLILVASLLLLHLRNPALILVIFFLAFGLFYLSEGLTGVGWFELVARIVPEKSRGRFFALYQFTAGILGFASGFWVKALLHKSTSLETFGNLFLINLVLLAVSMAFLAAIREKVQATPIEPIKPSAPPGSLTGILRDDPAFLRLLIIQLLMGASTLSSPFYAIHATDRLGITPETVGYFVAAFTLGQALGCLIWGHLSDHLGNRLVIRLCFICASISPLLAISFDLASGRLAPAAGPFALVYPLVFLFMGLAWGAWIGFTNYAMETAPEERRPTYVGILNTANAPIMLYPVIGGSILGATSFPFLFGLTLATLALGLTLASGLPGPKNASPLGPPERDPFLKGEF